MKYTQEQLDTTINNAMQLLKSAVEDFQHINEPYGSYSTGGLLVTVFPWKMDLIFKIY